MKWGESLAGDSPLVPKPVVRYRAVSILLHVSVRRNLASIWKLGISPAFSQGARAECWFCSRSKRAWAIQHVAERHDVPLSEVVVFRVSVPRSRLVLRRRGVWTCDTVVRSIRSVSVPVAPAA